MLEIDYNFIRDQGDKIENFSPPEILNDISDNIVLLEAPNASGKSTFLNIMALGLFGHRLDPSKCHISPSIRERMNDLLNSSNHKLKFQFSIKNQNGSYEINSTKSDFENKDFMVYEIDSGKKNILTDVSFPQKIYLIYDIPENPLERLPHLIQQIKSQQVNLGIKVGNLKSHTYSILKEIRDSKNPQKIEELRKSIANIESETEELSIEIQDLQSLEKKIVKYQAYKFFRYYSRVKENMEFQLIKLSEKIRNIDKNKKTKNSQYSNQLTIANQYTDSISNIHKKISQYLPGIFIECDSKSLNAIKKWDAININSVIDDYYIDPEYLELAEFFRNEIENKSCDSQLQKASERRRFYSDLLTVLRNYETKNFPFPGTSKSLQQIIADLESECQKNSHLAITIDNYSKTLDLLTLFSNDIKKLSPVLEKLQGLKEKIKTIRNSPENFEELDKKFEIRQTELNEVIAFLNNYSKIITEESDPGKLTAEDLEKIIKSLELENPEISSYISFTEDQLSNELEKIRTHIHNYSDKIERNNQIVKKIGSDLSKFENKPEHKYQEEYVTLENLYQRCENLERIIRQSLGDRLSNLEAKKPANNLEEQQFYDSIFRYLSKKIPEVPYIDEIIKTGKIDLIQQCIIDENEKRIIKFSDISTGQGISIYLRSLLRLPREDPRKIIAFFDEIATMDSKSLKYLIDDLVLLKQNNRLLFAILVQKSDKFQVRNLIGSDDYVNT